VTSRELSLVFIHKCAVFVNEIWRRMKTIIEAKRFLGEHV
jgi:hypothetical protein